MPYKAKKPCKYIGCPELTAYKYCDKHKKMLDREYNKHRRDPDTYKRYGRKWRRIRDSYIARYPLCERCKESGRLTPAEEVHHVKPLSDGGTHTESNLMSLCTPCHSSITRAAYIETRRG